MSLKIKTRNQEFIQDFHQKYLFLYDDYSERFGKLKVYQSLQKGVEYYLVAVKEVEIQQVEDKLKICDQHMYQSIEEYIDDFMKAVEKVLDQQMNFHSNILQTIAFECKGEESNSSWKLNQITLYYEYFSNSIMQEAKRKYCFNSIGFVDTEIWQILYNVTSLMCYLEGQNRWIGDLIPENIFYAHSNGEIKISPYKMSPLDDIKKRFIYVKTNNSQQFYNDSNIAQQNTFCSLNITKYFKSDTLSLGISLMRVMICNDMFSFEVFEEMKKGYIEQATLKELIKKCSQKYNGFLMKVLSVMTDEDEEKRPSGTDLFKFLLQYTQQIKQGIFNGSQMQEFSFLEENGNQYDFKKSPSLFASQKFSQIIRKNSLALDDKGMQEDENNKMQKILDSVKKIISKKVITDNQSSIQKETKRMKRESEFKDKVDNDTYESLTEITGKESIADLQQIPTDNNQLQMHTNRNIIPSIPFISKSSDVRNSIQEYGLNNLSNNNESVTKALMNVTNTTPQLISQVKESACNFIDNSMEQENVKKSVNQTGIRNSQNVSQANSNNSILNNTFANNYYNSLYPPPKKYDITNSQTFKNSDYSNYNQSNWQSPINISNIQTEQTNAVAQNLHQIHQNQLQTIKLAYQELEKIQGDIKQLTNQRQILLEQNKRLMEINSQLIQQNKERALSTTGYSGQKSQLETPQMNQEKYRERALSSERCNQFQYQQIQPRISSHSQPPLHFIDVTQSPPQNLISSTNSSSRQVSKTPIQAIPRRELNLPPKHISQPASMTHSPMSNQSLKDQQRNKGPSKFSNQIVQLYQKPENNYSIRSSFKDGVLESDFVLSGEIPQKNNQQVDTLVVSPAQKQRITKIQSPKLMNEIPGVPRKISILIDSTDQQINNNNISQNNQLNDLQKQMSNNISSSTMNTTKLQKLVTNNQVIQSPLSDSQQFRRISVRSITQDPDQAYLDNGKNASNSISREASPSVIYTPQNYINRLEQREFNGVDMNFSLNNLPLKQNNSSTINNTSQQQICNSYFSKNNINNSNCNFNNSNINNDNTICRRQIRNYSNHQQNTNDINFIQNENQFDKQQTQEGIVRTKSNSMQIFYPLNLHNRQSRISTNASNNINTQKFSESSYPIKTSQSINNNNQNQQILFCAKQNNYTENDKPIFQPLISQKLEENFVQKKSASLPKPSPTLNSSSQKDLKQSKGIVLLNNENTQKINYQKNNNNLDVKRNESMTLNNQIQIQPLCRQSSDSQQYAIIHRRQQSLTECQKLRQITTNPPPIFNQKNENKMNSSLIKLKNPTLIQTSQLQEVNQNQKGYTQLYNAASTPTSQNNQQTMRNSFTHLSQNQNTLQSERQPSQSQNNFTQILQRNSKILAQISTTNNVRKDDSDRQKDSKINSTKSPKNMIPPPFMGIGILKKSEIKNTLNENPLKTLQNNIKNQYAK